MNDIQDQIDKYEGILWDLENANRLSNPSDDKKKKKKIEQTKKKIASLKNKLDEGKTMRITRRQLRKIIKEEKQKLLTEMDRPRLSFDGNHAIQDLLEKLEDEFHKEFFAHGHDDTMQRIRQCIMEEYVAAYEEHNSTVDFNDSYHRGRGIQ